MGLSFLVALGAVFTLVVTGNLLVLRLRHRRIDDGTGSKQFLRATSDKLSYVVFFWRFIFSGSHKRLADPTATALVYLTRVALAVFVLNAVAALILGVGANANG